LDLIVRPQKAGEYLFNVDFLDWITGGKYGNARTTITVR
jgi:hypothetical protein